MTQQEKLFTFHKSDLGAGAGGLRSVVNRQMLLIREWLGCGLETGCSLYEVVTAFFFSEGLVVHSCHGCKLVDLHTH